MTLVRIKFVSKKISKVRWKPQSNSVFVTGSWDDSKNNICVWIYPGSSSALRDTTDSLDYVDPYVVAETDFDGFVTDLKVLSADVIFASSSKGSLYMYKFTDQAISLYHSWDKIHTFESGGAAVTGISVKSNEVASVGEDGRICIFNFQKLQNIRKIDSLDQCSFSVVSYLRYQEVVAGNVLGYLKAYDLRVNSDEPSQTLTPPGDYMGLMSINVHPTQPHVFATGHENGTICVWDLRQDSRPTTTLTSHTSAVMDLLFHPVNPDFLYTCSMDGMVWQWNAAVLKTNPMPDEEYNQHLVSGNPWLNCDIAGNKLDITSLFARNTVCVNSLDITNSTLLWGSDNEALYILPNILV